ncbi:hypothetical protein KIW84_014695, partial [Lathyrus oleraceus]
RTKHITSIVTPNPNGHFFFFFLLLSLLLKFSISTSASTFYNQTMQENDNVDVSKNPSPPPPPPPLPPPQQQQQQHNRRPKTREVSSRFMSPSIPSTQRRQQRDDSDDENSESSFPIGYSFQKKLQQQRSVKLFKETTNRVFDNIPNPSSSYHHPSKQPSSRIATPCPSRPDTPTHTMTVTSRYRQTPHHQPHRSINARSSAAAKLFQSRNSRDDIDIHCSTQSLPELRSETGDVLMQQPKVPTGSAAEKFSNNLSRSVSLSSSGVDRVKVGGLPPVAPQFAKSAADSRKGKKGSHQDDVTSLKLLHNRYLQWRFANAKAENAIKVQQKECEKALLSRAMKISEMRDSVNKKRIELEHLRRLQTLSVVLEAQTPYLDEWSAMEEDYSVSITEAIQALLNASAQLPTGGNVRVDVKEVGESLSSALKMMETIISNTQKLMPKKK